jgi:hypothetical protein
MGVRNPGIVTIRGTFGMRCATLALHGINVESAGNYHLMDDKSNVGRGIRPELPAHRRGIHPRKGISPGITVLFTRIKAGKIKMGRKSLKGNNSRISSSKSNFLAMSTLKKFKHGDLFEFKNKPYPALLLTSLQLNKKR